MTRATSCGAVILLISGLNLATPSMASEATQAQRLCTDKITAISGYSNFSHVWTEQIGNHKFQVHGKALPGDGHKWIFDCKVKRGQIKSYNYPGPVKRDNDDDNIGTVLAIGAGLAIVAALAASADDDNDKGTQSTAQKSVLEDDCMEQLQYRIRDDHHSSARVHLKESRLDGHDLVGEAKVRYDHSGHKAIFTCHFDRHWRLRDSSYHLY